MRKRGINTVITTVILILIILVAIAIIWGYIYVQTRGGSENAANQITGGCFSLSLNPVKCVYGAQGQVDVEVLVQRKSGDASLSGIRFLFSGADNSLTRDFTGALGQLETTIFNFSSLGFIPKTVDVAGIVQSGNQICGPTGTPVVCKPAVCGNGIVEPGEQCEGNIRQVCNFGGLYVTCDCGRPGDLDGNQTSCRFINFQQGNPNSILIQSPSNSTYQAIAFPATINLQFLLRYLNGGSAQAPINYDSCWYKLNNGASVPLPGCNDNTISLPAAGGYYLEVFSNDTFGNNISSNVTFGVINSNIAISSPQPLSIEENNQSVLLDFTTSFQPNTCWYEWYHYTNNTLHSTGNITIPCQPTTIQIPEGYYTLIVHANDSTNNVVSGSVKFVANDCPGDVNGGSVVDGVDLSNVLGATGAGVAGDPACYNYIRRIYNSTDENIGSGCSDLNGDGNIDGIDYFILSLHWGNTCPYVH